MDFGFNRGADGCEAGALAEDVTAAYSGRHQRNVTAPVDITSSATQVPVGIVYDYDGSLTDALLGAGAEILRMFLERSLRGADNLVRQAIPARAGDH